MNTFDADQAMRELTRTLQDAFGDRLVFVGLQGSCRRGEADEASDVDAVVVVDRVDGPTLAAYRHIVDALPWRDKACGFFGGAAELACWPGHELFQFRLDTVPYHGDLDAFLLPIRREDAVEALRVGAATVYHMVCHTAVHEDGDLAPALVGACRMLFFPLLAKHWLATGEYAASRADLLGRLEGRDRDLLAVSTECRGNPAVITEAVVVGVMDWCRDMLVTTCA